MNAISPDRPLCFLHAADLHLDAAFKGISSDAPSHIRKALARATFTAFERLVAMGCRLRPDFVLLAGDIHNHEEGSLRAQLALRDGCRALGDAGVRVFMVHGNHDPYGRRSTAISLPDNVTVFGPGSVEAAEVFRNGQLAAVVHGISHNTDRERTSLARKFRRSPQQVPQVGLLHCTLDVVASADVYAPATLAELQMAGLDYWALGHIHAPQVVHQAPHVVYSGSTQGLHVNEQGAHGCMLVEIAPDGVITTALYPLAPVVWGQVSVDISAHATLDSLDNALFGAAEQAAQQCGAGDGEGVERMLDGRVSPEPPEGVVLRLELTGRGALDGLLRREGAIRDLLERLREGLASLSPFVWIKDLELACRPELSMDVQRQRQDVLGEALRLALRLREDSKDSAHAGMLQDALEGLFERPRVRKAVSPPDGDELAALLADAEMLCMTLLEADQ